MLKKQASTSRVYVIDDDDSVRDALVFLMETEGFEVVGFDSAEKFIDGFDNSVPACLVVDVLMPGMSGLELQKQLVKMGVKFPVIILTGHGDVHMAVEAMKAGASDFVEKPFNNESLIIRIRELLDEEVKQHQKDEMRENQLKQLELLTPREHEVMDLLVQGKLNKVIAAELNISARTVEAHRANIMDKLNAKSLADIVRLSLLQ